jgi:hypothetical protein
MIGLIAYILIICDFLLTRFVVSNGLAVEGNPILGAIFNSQMYLIILAGMGGLIWWTYKVRINPKIYRLYYVVIVSRILVLLYSIGGIINGGFN